MGLRRSVTYLAVKQVVMQRLEGVHLLRRPPRALDLVASLQVPDRKQITQLEYNKELQ